MKNNFVLKFDTLRFIPVTDSNNRFFAFDKEKYPEGLWNSTPKKIFECYPITSDGFLNMNVSYQIVKEDLKGVWVKIDD